MDSSFVAENDTGRTRLAALVATLTDADMETTMEGGWTIAATLAHLAFWARLHKAEIDHWKCGQGQPAEEPDRSADDLNDALLPEWRALPSRTAARLAIEAAEAVDREVSEVDGTTVEEIVSKDKSWLLHRHWHRREHLDQIERALRG
ncbi:MAG: maleylpyruvate isomerase N-terminal domain-containing protein [Actinomycetota bacterium]